MKDNESFESIVPVSRRGVLKAGAATAVGVGLFSGIAAATNPRQINFCGCTQVCLDRAFNPDEGRDVGGVFKVVLAKEDGEGGWMYEEVLFGDDPEERFQDFCFEAVGEWEGWKVIAVKPGAGEAITEAYCNPGQCAEKALADLPDSDLGYTCTNDDWGTYDDITEDTVGNPQVLIVHGQCGKPGRTPNPGPNPGGPNND